MAIPQTPLLGFPLSLYPLLSTILITVGKMTHWMAFGNVAIGAAHRIELYKGALVKREMKLVLLVWESCLDSI